MATGVGSNDIGLDRGQLGNVRLVKFVKAGNKLLLVQPNQNYRALTNNELEHKSVSQAFAKSVIFGFKILEENNGNFVIDLTPFLMEDAHGVSNTLMQKKEGIYKIDLSKSALSLDQTKAFPKNVEFESLLTFKGNPTGSNLAKVTPTPSLLSVIQHHSFIELPDNNYKPRAFDVRSGAIAMSYLDYATPVQDHIKKRFIIRHRLQKKTPNSKSSEAIEPIIYYLDPGTPEPVKTALLEGASWWNEAFEAIGFTNAFQVKMLPEDADPMDCRYNVIQWVHRSTRGWSYGGSVVDPRTGEIIKGHVSLGSLRIRQDFLIAQALMNKPFAKNDDNYKPMLNMALARIRQLSAHEVGHTLGFAHNFTASSSNRSSVMDYPHPLIRLKKDKIDISNAYASGIGEWDKIIVAYSYSEFKNNNDESKKLNAILNTAKEKGLRFISDQDARAKGGAHAKAHLWDNGKSASRELNTILDVRKKAISNFSKDNIKSYEPYTVLEDVFVPLYFFHRYQTEAAVKVIGGLDYNYAVKGDEQLRTKTISKASQEEALKAVLRTLSVETIAIPSNKLDLFPPRAYSYDRTRESFKSKVGVAFDPFSAASTSSEMTLSLLLHPERANRLVLQKSLDKKQIGLKEVINDLLNATIEINHKDSYKQNIQHQINENVLNYLMHLAISNKSYFQVKAITRELINDLAKRLPKESSYDKAFINEYIRTIERFNEFPDKFILKNSPKIPDGSPIGLDICNYISN